MNIRFCGFAAFFREFVNTCLIPFTFTRVNLWFVVFYNLLFYALARLGIDYSCAIRPIIYLYHQLPAKRKLD